MVDVNNTAPSNLDPPGPIGSEETQLIVMRGPSGAGKSPLAA